MVLISFYDYSRSIHYQPFPKHLKKVQLQNCPTRSEIAHQIHYPAFSYLFPSIFIICSFNTVRALDSCDFEAPSEMPVIVAISLCEYPSIAYKLNTMRYPGDSFCISTIKSF